MGTHSANHHEVTLVQLSFEFSLIDAKPVNLSGDLAHDSDPLELRARLCLAEVVPTTAGAMGIPFHEFPRICPVYLHLYAP